MKTIKIIDLLNKIANGEKAPKKIKTDINTIWIYDENNQRYHLQDAPYITLSFEATNNLNNGVEIIEESEQDIDIQNIEEIGIMLGWALLSEEEKVEKQKESVNFTLDFFGKKINEILEKQNILIRAVKQLDNKIKEI